MPWMKYDDLFALVEKMVEVRDPNQGLPSFSRVFDTMVAICASAGPEETIDIVNGNFTSCGHVVIYENWNVDGRADETVECDGWILTILQNDGGFLVEKIGDSSQQWHMSHEEPMWPLGLREFLHRTYWRPLTMEGLPASG